MTPFPSQDKNTIKSVPATTCVMGIARSHGRAKGLGGGRDLNCWLGGVNPLFHFGAATAIFTYVYKLFTRQSCVEINPNLQVIRLKYPHLGQFSWGQKTKSIDNLSGGWGVVVL